MQKLTTLTPPSDEPVTLAEMKLHLRVTAEAEDDALAAMITAARVAAENFTGLAFMQQGLRLTLDSFDGAVLELPKTPLIAITAVTVDGAAKDDYTADIPTARIITANLPRPAAPLAGIRIDFTAGFGETADDVPAPLRQGIKQLVTRLFENRGEGMEAALMLSGAAALFQPYRRMRIA